MSSARILSMLLVGWAACLANAAEPWRNEVEVTLFAIPESVWLERFEGKGLEHPALWLRLNGDADAGRVATPVDFRFRLVREEAVVQRKGADTKFAESWETWQHADFRAVPTQTTHRFVGTTVELAQEDTSEGRPLRVKLNLEHHVAPPAMRRFNYANAATGPERDRLSVEFPQFEKVEWRGELAVSQEWRLVANVLHLPVIASSKPGTPPTRFLLFIKRA